MAAPALAATVRFIEPGRAQYYWVPTIANTSAPTAAELNAGTDLTGQVAAVNGFTVTSDTVEAPDFASRFVAKVAGKINAEDSSLDFYRSNTSSDVRTLLTRDLTGYVVVFPEGATNPRKMDVFPVTVTTAAKQHTDNDPAKIQIQFVVTAVPTVDLTVPAGV